MMEVKDQGIKLFGKKIALPEDSNFSFCSSDEDSGAVSRDESSTDRDRGLTETNETCSAEKKVSSELKEETEKDDAKQGDKKKNSKASAENDNPKTPSIGEESATVKPEKTENDQTTDTTKTLKKPDKILPCPRCNSMETKFCYYNNYNVNQPRHFCKSCQRYWTAGGTMRNVPVGAGRRKNKNSSTSICSHITIPDALQGARVDPPNGPHHKTNGTVLYFNSADPQKSSPDVARNGNDCSNGSFPSGVPCIPWPYPLNSSIPVPIPVPFYPTPYWSYNVPGSWSINPWLSPPATPNQKEAALAAASGQHLGKHTREGELIKLSNVEVQEVSERKVPESSILIPKTLRIDDPDEAAKSSIWETLGIKNDCIISRGGLFKAFERKGTDGKNHSKATASPFLQANPAAMSRSLSFHERA